MIITLYQFAKKLNSTKVPSGAGTDVTCTLKEPVDILNPVFLLQKSNFTIGVHNYIKWTLDSQVRYARINKVTFISNDIVEISCIQDTLATWYSNITNNMYFVERCSDSNVYSNGALIADNYPTLSRVNADPTSPDQQHLWLEYDPFYIVGVIATGIRHPTCIRGSVTYIVMDATEMHDFLNDLLNLTFSNADKTPIDYIVSVMWFYGHNFNFTISGLTEYSESQINLGTYRPTIKYKEIPSLNFVHNLQGVVKFSNTISLDPITHPQAATRGEYLNYPPYSYIKCILNPFGEFTLDYSLMGSLTEVSTRFNFDTYLDLTTGDCILNIKLGQSYVVTRLRTNIGVQCIVGQRGINSLNDLFAFAGSAISTMGSIAVAGPAGAIPTLPGMASAAMRFETGCNSGKTGAVGSMVEKFDGHLRARYEYLLISDDQTLEIGRPSYKYVQLSTIAAGSYIKLKDAHVSINGIMQAEQEEIENILNSGYFN